MREILFRGKTKETGEWKYGFVAKNKYYSETDWVIVIEDEEGYWTYWAEVIPETIGQFTGLHDKNGVEIFEGDIYTAFGSRKYEIRFINGAFCGGLLGGDDSIFAPLGWESPEDDEDLYVSIDFFKFIQVIGNIHDNPELLS